MESYIVSNADEIAQIYSDYLDCCENGIGEEDFNKSLIYKDSFGNNSKEKAKKAREELIDCFVECLSKNEYSFPLKEDCDFFKKIKDFGTIRKKIFKRSRIGLFDYNKKAIVETIFAFFYEHPEEIEPKEMARIANSIKYNCTDLDKTSYKSLKFNGNKIKPEQFCLTIANVKKNLRAKGEEIKKESLKRFLKLYLRGIAVYISMMTDNYAEHLCKKIVSCSAGKLF
ncbi:MAG: hypothetical protein MJ228_05310 [Bacilli bacterium]|nr:hypothetical protein [Bacilli bacterium]